MKFEVDIKGVEKTTNTLRKIGSRIDRNTNNAVSEAGRLGQAFAQAKAPRFHGNLVRAITMIQPVKNEAWIISSPSPSDDNFPLNVAFETGDFGRMTMFGPGGRVAFRPRDPNTIGFMTQTADFLDREFSRRLLLEVERSLK